MRFSTQDKINSTYEVYKHIQCKRGIKSNFEYTFKWSGTTKPRISSITNQLETPEFSDEKDKYDRIKLKFASPLLYNQTAIIHILMDCSDLDNSASAHLGFKVDHPVDALHFRVELYYKPENYNEPAILEKRSLESELSTEYQSIKAVNFDSKSKSYDYFLLHPELNHHYRFRWEK